MATRSTVTCDMEHAREREGHPRQFGLGDEDYEIDLCAQDSAKLDAMVAPYISAGRRVAMMKEPKFKPRSARERRRSADIRAWALEKGLKITERGRIPVSVVDRYDREHS